MPGLIDTIVAPLTAPGAGERSAVRLSGPDAWALAGRVLELPGAPQPGRVLAAQWLLEPALPVDVEVLAFRAPRSFTGEDVLEIHLRGWPVLVAELVARLVAAGARPAAPGEFSRRAVATGRLDLAGALALARLVGARDAEEASAAAAALTAGLSARHAALRDALLDVLALLEAHVDFEEEDTEAVGEPALRAGLLRARALAAALAADCGRLPAADGETDVVLLGPPNAGKSLLFRALCPGAEAAVSPVPGTTRDALEARVVRDGRRWRVLDGPGLQDPAAGHAALTALDRRAMELWESQLPPLAVVLLVHDAAVPLTAGGRARLLAAAGARALVPVLNKCDLLDVPKLPASGSAHRGAASDAGAAHDVAGALPVSALRGTGLDALWGALAAAAPAPRGPDLAVAQEAVAAAAVLPLLDEALSGPLAGALPVVALALRDALARLDAAEDRAGSVEAEVLDRIFASFCIGK